MENEVRVTLRLPADLHSDISALANRFGSSLNTQIVTMLRQWFTNDTRFSELEQRMAALEKRLN